MEVRSRSTCAASPHQLITGGGRQVSGPPAAATPRCPLPAARLLLLSGGGRLLPSHLCITRHFGLPQSAGSVKGHCAWGGGRESRL